MIVISEGNWFSLIFLRRITNSLHHEAFENWFYSIGDGNSSNDFFHDDFNVCGIFSKLWSFRDGPNLVRNESLQISFCQKLLGTDQTRLFMMISISLVHSLSFSSLRRTTNSVYYESIK